MVKIHILKSRRFPSKKITRARQWSEKSSFLAQTVTENGKTKQTKKEQMKENILGERVGRKRVSYKKCLLMPILYEKEFSLTIFYRSAGITG